MREGRKKKKSPPGRFSGPEAGVEMLPFPKLLRGQMNFLKKPQPKTLHKSHCCACVGCALKEGKGHRLWYIKWGKKILFWCCGGGCADFSSPPVL